MEAEGYHRGVDRAPSTSIPREWEVVRKSTQIAQLWVEQENELRLEWRYGPHTSQDIFRKFVENWSQENKKWNLEEEGCFGANNYELHT